MHRTLLAIVILVRLASAPFARADEPVSGASSLAAAAARQAQTATITAPAPRRPMDLGEKWAGIGFVGVGTSIALTTAFGDCLGGADYCHDSRQHAYALAGIYTGTGAALLLNAHLQRLRPEPGPDHKVMRPGLKWAGIGLLGGSVMAWAGSAQRNCAASLGCDDRKNFDRAVAAATATAGGVVLAKAFATRRPSWPSVVLAPDRAYVQQRIGF